MQTIRAASMRRALMRPRLSVWKKRITLKADGYPQDFAFIPDFFSVQEQRVLLSAALEKLDKMETRQYRRRRKEFLLNSHRDDLVDVQNIFLPDEYYCFEKGHFDGVIRNFREMHISAWPEDNPELSHLIERLHSVHPKQATQTHLLHLASDGEIFPHVDNLGASGSWILGLNLGNTRALRFQNVDDPSDSFEMLVPSGSVYMQRDTLRYYYKHSVLGRGHLAGVQFGGGQRLSIMIRDKLQN